MEVLGVDRLMDRLLDNPNLKNLKKTAVAAFIKDMLSISGLSSVLVPKFIYIKMVDGRGDLPTEYSRVSNVYLCSTEAVTNFPAEYFTNGRLGHTNSDDILREGVSKWSYGTYRINHNKIYIDTEAESVLEVHYEAAAVDSLGFPVFPYHGSLMQAMENYVKYRYYTILAENNQVPDTLASKSHREYQWYIGQYTSVSDMLSYDEAVTFANSWQRLIDTRVDDPSAKGFEEHLNL